MPISARSPKHLFSALGAGANGPPWRYLFLCVLFLLACGLQFRFAASALFPSDEIEYPFRLEASSTQPVFTLHVFDAGRRAGLREGQIASAINGVPIRGAALFGEVFSQARPGDRITVTVVAPGGATGSARTIALTVQAPLDNPGAPSFSRSAFRFLLVVFLPALCIALGFWGAAARPYNLRAWLLLPLMLAFASYLNPGVESWKPGLRDLEMAYNVFLSDSFGIWLVLFGLYFPKRFSDARSWRWLGIAKWFLIAPLAVQAILDCLIYVQFLENYRSIFFLQAWVAPFRPLLSGCNVAAILAMLACLGVKYRRAASLDQVRRLRLLFVSACVSLVPLVTITLIANRAGMDVEQYFNPLIYSSAWLLFFLFPLTLTYVSVAHRAMELRVFVRQGIHYALARRSLSAFRLLVLSVCVSAAVYSSRHPELHSQIEIEVTLLIAFAISAAEGPLTNRLAPSLDRQWFRVAVQSEEILAGLCVTNANDTRTLLETVTAGIAQVFGVKDASVFLEIKGAYSVAYSIGQSVEQPIEIQSHASALQYLLVERRPIRVYFDDPGNWVHNLPPDEQCTLRTVNAELAVPLIRNNQLIGFISLGPRKSEEPYSNGDLRILGSVGQQASLALENTILISSLAVEISERERKTLEKEAAERANKAKSAFLTQLAHELRTPLNSIIGYTDILLEEAEDSGAAAFVKDVAMIRSAGMHLLTLLNSILDISKIEAGKMELFLEEFAVSKLIQETLFIVMPLISKNRNHLQYDANVDAGVMFADGLKLRQTLVNLLSNAAKFTSDGVITLEVAPVMRQDVEAIQFVVADSGIGMTGVQAQKLFAAYSQADNSIAAKFGGTGLGLVICRHFCTMMGGSISLDTELGKGSRFIVEIPRRVLPKQTVELAASLCAPVSSEG